MLERPAILCSPGMQPCPLALRAGLSFFLSKHTCPCTMPINTWLCSLNTSARAPCLLQRGSPAERPIRSATVRPRMAATCTQGQQRQKAKNAVPVASLQKLLARLSGAGSSTTSNLELQLRVPQAHTNRIPAAAKQLQPHQKASQRRASHCLY